MKGKHLRTIAKELIRRYPDKITADFTANKEFVRTLNIMKSGEELNKLAGQLVILYGQMPKAIAA